MLTTGTWFKPKQVTRGRLFLGFSAGGHGAFDVTKRSVSSASQHTAPQVRLSTQHPSYVSAEKFKTAFDIGLELSPSQIWVMRWANNCIFGMPLWE